MNALLTCLVPALCAVAATVPPVFANLAMEQ